MACTRSNAIHVGKEMKAYHTHQDVTCHILEDSDTSLAYSLFNADILFFHGATEQPVLSRCPSTIKEQMIFRSERNVLRCAGLQLAALDCC